MLHRLYWFLPKDRNNHPDDRNNCCPFGAHLQNNHLDSQRYYRPNLTSTTALTELPTEQLTP